MLSISEICRIFLESIPLIVGCKCCSASYDARNSYKLALHCNENPQILYFETVLALAMADDGDGDPKATT